MQVACALCVYLLEEAHEQAWRTGVAHALDTRNKDLSGEREGRIALDVWHRQQVVQIRVAEAAEVELLLELLPQCIGIWARESSRP